MTSPFDVENERIVGSLDAFSLGHKLLTVVFIHRMRKDTLLRMCAERMIFFGSYKMADDWRMRSDFSAWLVRFFSAA